jgi:acyl-CoA reductase-like NAD-dependent aldehyde dehydrogenase
MTYPIDLLVAGQLRSAAGSPRPAGNPATGASLAEVNDAIDEAQAVVRAAGQKWREWPRKQESARPSAPRGLAALIGTGGDQLVSIIVDEVGKPIGKPAAGNSASEEESHAARPG